MNIVADKIFVYDGNAAYRDGVYRVVAMPKNATVGNALVSGLRELVIVV